MGLEEMENYSSGQNKRGSDHLYQLPRLKSKRKDDKNIGDTDEGMASFKKLQRNWSKYSWGFQ